MRAPLLPGSVPKNLCSLTVQHVGRQAAEPVQRRREDRNTILSVPKPVSGISIEYAEGGRRQSGLRDLHHITSVSHTQSSTQDTCRVEIGIGGTGPGTVLCPQEFPTPVTLARVSIVQLKHCGI